MFQKALQKALMYNYLKSKKTKIEVDFNILTGF
jgi:hypothetical protein